MPSYVRLPIITATTIVVPGSGCSRGSADSGVRSTMSSPSRPNTAIRENRSKYTANPSPRSIHASTPYTAIATSVTTVYPSATTATFSGALAWRTASSNVVKPISTRPRASGRAAPGRAGAPCERHAADATTG